MAPAWIVMALLTLVKRLSWTWLSDAPNTRLTG